jgi:hypothetical protein
MSEEVNDNTKNFIDQLSKGNSVEAGEAFKDALRDKVASQLDAARKDIASNMFNPDQPEAADHSDPKPEIADPGTFNRDGSVSPTTDLGNDGEAQIDLTPADNGTPDTMVGVDLNAGEQTS